MESSNLIVTSCVGLAMGFITAFVALVCARRYNGVSSTVKAPTPAAAAAPPSRRQRAQALLASLRQEATEEPAAIQGDAEVGDANNEDGSSQWSSEDGSDDTQSTDSEYERMEALRLKMVFVIYKGNHDLPASSIAVLTAGAGVGLVESISDDESRSDIAKVAADRRRQWQEWYAWWNQIGCGKITLKCPDKETFNSVRRSAESQGIPMWTAQLGDESSESRRARAPLSDADKEEVVVIALGPAPASVLDPITGKLKLFS